MEVSPLFQRSAAPPAVPAVAWGWTIFHGVVWSFAAGWLGVVSIVEETGLSALWVGHGVFLVALTLTLGPGPIRAGRRSVALAVLMFAAHFAGGLVGGAGIGFAWLTATNLLTAITGILLYRVFRARSWVPRDTDETIWLMLALGAASLVGALLGAFPGAGAGIPADPTLFVLLWFRGWTALAVAAYGILPLLYRADDPLTTPRSARHVAMLTPVAGACLWLPTLYPDAPLSCLYVVPSLWAGMTLNRRWAGAFLAAFCFAAGLTPDPVTAHRAAGSIGYEVVFEFAFVFLSHLTMLLVAFRERTTRLHGQVGELAASERVRTEMLTQVLQSMNDGLILTDRDGEVAMANTAAARVTAGPIPDVLDRAWAQRFDLEAADRQAEVADRQAEAAGRAVRSVSLSALVRPDQGQTRMLELGFPGAEGRRRIVVTSSDLDEGRQRLTLLMLKDLTAVYERQRELEAFAGTVAHDLKGPLSALFGWLEAAADEVADGDADAGAAALQRAHGAVDRMESLIDDYLAYAVSSGGSLRLTEVRLLDVVTEILAVYAGQEDGPTFDVDVPHVLRADASLTRQLMANIIGNGIKYSRDGERPYIHVLSRDDDPGWAEVQVADRGRGLQPGDEQRIFGRLNRSAKDAGAVQGIGLGLALCHAIVTRHGGRIVAENNEWGGATFRFTMPSVERAGA